MPHPFVDRLGARFVEVANGTSLLSLQVGPDHFNGHGVVHGGVLFTLADTGMGAALYTTLAPSEICTTIEVKINYFRPVLEGEVECRSRVVHRGRSTATLESELVANGKLVGKATGTFAILRREAPNAA